MYIDRKNISDTFKVDFFKKNFLLHNILMHRKITKIARVPLFPTPNFSYFSHYLFDRLFFINLLY